jgi:trehalose utilization protein
MSASPIRVTVWNEGIHEKNDEKVKAIYPNGIHAVIAGHLNEQAGLTAGTATLEEPEHGLTSEVLENTDVLIWWAHMAHGAVADEVVARVQRRVLNGMGLILLHSAHCSKIFQRLMGTSCNLMWREAQEKERFWVVAPSHPIADGLPEHFELPHEEMYGEFFDIPAPDALVFVSWFAGGEIFRSGCCFERGHGRIFYFRPGHESHPTYYDQNIMRVITNAVRWAAPKPGLVKRAFAHSPEPLEPLG